MIWGKATLPFLLLIREMTPHQTKVKLTELQQLPLGRTEVSNPSDMRQGSQKKWDADVHI
jgi:hypothetical protein